MGEVVAASRATARRRPGKSRATGAAIVGIPAFGAARSLLALPLLSVTHIFYGIGFWRGLFTSLKPVGERAPVEVKLETITR